MNQATFGNTIVAQRMLVISCASVTFHSGAIAFDSVHDKKSWLAVALHFFVLGREPTNPADCTI